MKEEQYNRVVAIHKRINELNNVLKEISPSSKHMLNYVDSENRACSIYSMRCIGDLFDKHDVMIREEIAKEIEDLKKEIEEM